MVGRRKGIPYKNKKAGKEVCPMAASSAREAAYQTLWGRIVTMELKPGTR